MAAQTISLPRPIVNVCGYVSGCCAWVWQTYHAVSGVFGVCGDDAVCGGVVACCVHGV